MNQLYEGITDTFICLAKLAVVIALGTYELLSPVSQSNLSRHYKKKRPHIFTIGVTCPDKSTGNSNHLVIMEEHSFQKGTLFSGDLIRFPILYLNNKMVSRALNGKPAPELFAMGLPIDPIERVKLEIKTFHDAASLNAWVIYVDPATFTYGEYQQIISCYEAHREEIDSTLENSKFTPWWTQKENPPRSFSFNYSAQCISHIVYGAMPQPQIFSPQTISKGYLSEGKRISVSSEALIIYPDGQWLINIRHKEGIISPWNDHPIGKGEIIFNDTEKVLNVEWLNFFNLDSIKNISVYEYFTSLVDSQGNKLTDFYRLGNIPSKFHT
jgi:hypothetical protein